MADEHHEHHGPHGLRPAEVRPPEPAEQDPAAQSLADALRVSFRLLTVVMAGVVVAFLLSGISCVDPTEVAVVRVFDSIEREVDEGLAYNWPRPVGSMESVSTSNRTLTVDTFWMHEEPRDKDRPLDERRPPRGGLRPGWDGYLLTGDRYILHVKLKVEYVVSDATDYQTAAVEPEDLLRSQVCNATVHEAGRRTATELQQGAGESLAGFVSDIERETNERLTRLNAGMRIVRINLGSGNITWPLRALPAFKAVQSASSEKQRQIDSAEQDASSTLRSAAGENYRKLVGNLEYVIRGKGGDADGEALPGLIDQYRAKREQAEALTAKADAARRAGDQGADAMARRAAQLDAESDELLREIYAVLTAPTTGGEASSIIARARAEREEKLHEVRARAERFAKLLPKYRDPAVSWQVVQREWFQTRDRVMGYPLFETIRLTPGQKVIWRIGQDPTIAGQLELEQLRREEKKRRQGDE
ncbi:MAG: hypothetical protein KGY99_00275 [Phycisphaerae bacterium]|nr:hypothetical protein [Phycisphaerae bacterium]